MQWCEHLRGVLPMYCTVQGSRANMSWDSEILIKSECQETYQTAELASVFQGGDTNSCLAEKEPIRACRILTTG